MTKRIAKGGNTSLNVAGVNFLPSSSNRINQGASGSDSKIMRCQRECSFNVHFFLTISGL